jgi:outer membrane protein assembly factor BamB
VPGGGMLYEKPAMADGTVYVGSLDNFLYAVHT